MPIQRNVFSTVLCGLIAALMIVSALSWSLHVGDRAVSSLQNSASTPAMSHTGMTLPKDTPADIDATKIASPACLDTVAHRRTTLFRSYVSWLGQPPVTPPIA